MTQQVFRNPGTPTFYIEDVLTPSGGGGVIGTFSNVVVNNPANGATVLITKTDPTPASFIGMQLLQTGHAPSASLAQIGANTAEASQSAFVTASAGMDLKFGAGGVERARLKNTGIADNPAATLALTQAAGDTTIYSRTLSNGVFASAWTPNAGFLAPSAVNTMLWARNGNIISVNLYCNVPTPGVTPAICSAFLTLPIARTVPFTGSPAEVSGVAVMIDGTGGNISGEVGSTTRVLVAIASRQAVPVPSQIIAAFSYSLS